MRRKIAVFALMALLTSCLVSLAGCGSADHSNLKGEWKVKDTSVTVVFTDDKFRMVGIDYDYTIDTSAKTITYTTGEMTGTAKYSFAEGNTRLVLDEDDGSGGTTSTTFEKVSDDTSAEPSAGEAE